MTGTIRVSTTLISAAALGIPASLPQLLATELDRDLKDLSTLRDYAHDNQIGKQGQYWKGRKPASGDLLDALPQLVQDDQIGPAMGREVDAQFARDPEWDARRDGKVIDPEDELVSTLTDWHREADLTAAAKDATRARWWAGRMVGRVYLPDEYAERLSPTSPDRPKDLASALELIHVEAVDPRQGGPLIDAHGRTLGYWNRYATVVDGKEATFVELYTPKKFLKFKLDQDKLVPLEEAEGDSPFASVANSARRPEYLMWHADRDGGSSITRSVRDQQDRINVVATYMGRNDEQTGYRQFIVSNAENPKTPDGKDAVYQMGPGVVVNLKGLTIDAVKSSANEKPQRHTPTWEVVDPLNPEEYHIPSINHWKKSLLEKLDQLWTLNPETQVSGESKRQSRKPFDKRVTFAAQDMGGFIAWALRAALMLAAQLLGQQEEYEGVTFVPKVFLDVDAVNLEELRVKLQMWQQGALQLTTLLEATPGVPDAATEAAAVEKEAEKRLKEGQAAAAVLGGLMGTAGGGDGQSSQI